MAIDIVEPRDPDFLWESNKALRKELEIKNTKIKQLKARQRCLAFFMA